MRGINLVVALLVSLAIVSCGGNKSSKNVGGGGTPDLNGNYQGTVNFSSDSTGTIQLSLVHSGSRVTGNFVSPGTPGSSGTVLGDLNGSAFTFTLSQTNPCAGSFSGTGTAGTGTLVGNYSGTDCRGNTTASFQASKR